MRFCYVYARVCVCARASWMCELGPLMFHVSRRELLATIMFFLLASFCLWCRICYLVGCVHTFCWSVLVLYSLYRRRLFTMACGCGLCSTSFPGGHQVDSLPPASSCFLQEQSSKSNNATEEKEPPWRAKLFVANGSLRHQLLRIWLSDLGALLKKLSLGT